jgi:competence protein ComEA
VPPSERLRTSLSGSLRERAVVRARLVAATILDRTPPRWLLAIGMVVGSAVALAVAWFVGALGSSEPRVPASVAELPRAVTTAPSVPASPGGTGATGSAGSRASAQSRPTVVVVHAAGAVRSPGLVRVHAGARVADVIEAAGGLADHADADAVNLAATVEDGQRLFVPVRGRPAPSVADLTPSVGPNIVSGGPSTTALGGSGGATAVVDLNAATAEQLDALPGVGPATANAIVEYRTKRGRFNRVDELLDVPGIGPAKLASIRSKVRI